MAFTKKGQTKAAAAFIGISAIYLLIFFKFGVQIPYGNGAVCFMTFTIKGQIKAIAAFKGIWPFIDWFKKIGMQIAYRQLFSVYFNQMSIKGRSGHLLAIWST